MDNPHSPSPLEGFIRRLIPYSWVVVLVCLLVTGFSVKPAVRLLGHVSTELSKLLPDDNHNVVLTGEIKKKFKKKGGGDLVILVSSPDPRANRQGIDALVDSLSRLPEVERVKYQKEGFEFLNDHKLLYIEVEDLEKIKDRINRKIQQEKLGGLYIDFESEETKKKGKDPFQFEDLSEKYRSEYVRSVKSPYYTNDDETAYALWVYPLNKDTSLIYFRAFYNLITDHVARFDKNRFGTPLTLSYAGSIRTRLDEYTTLTNDLKKGGIISLSGILFVLLLYFRRVASLLLIFIPLASGILGGFAICSFFLPHLNVVTSFLFAILSGLGVEIGIHLYARYQDDRESGIGRDNALINCLTKTGRSAVAGVTLNCVTFFILILNEFRGFSEFGWIAGIGLLVSLISFLIFFPALLIVAEQIHLLRFHKSRKRIVDWLKDRYPVFPRPRTIMVSCLVLFVLFLGALPFLGFEWNYSVLKIHIPETDQAKSLLRDITGRVNSAAAIIIPDEQTAGLIRQEYQQRRENDEGSPSIDFFRSHYDLFPKDQELKLALLKDIDELLKDDALNAVKGDKRILIDDFRSAIARTKKVKFQEDVPQGLKDAFFGRGEFSKEQVGFINPLPHLELDDGRNAVAFYNDAHRVDVGDKTYYAVSDSMIFADVLTTMFKDSRRVIILSMLVLIVVIYLDFRNWKKALLAFGSVFWGVMGMLALMAVFGLKFNFYNMIIVPLVLGMAVDNSVHLIHRFEEFKRTSVMNALFTSGAAAGLSSITNMLGYSGLVVAHHPGLNSIGNLAVMGMITCMIGSLVFLPATLQSIMNRSK